MAIERLNEDLNIVQELAIPGLDDDVDVIQKLDDEPNDVGGLSSAQLKAEFDKAGNIIKRYINESLLPAISETVVEAEERAQAESERAAAEQERADGENERVSAEQGRVDAETARAQAEQERAETEEERRAAEEGRVSAEKARAAAEQARADEHTGFVAQAQAAAGAQAELAAVEARKAASEAEQAAQKVLQAAEEANRAKLEADRANAIAGGDFATRPELSVGLSQKAGMSLVGPASLVEQLLPGGVLFLTDDADPADYAVTLDMLLDEGYKAAKGEADNLDTLLTVGRAKVLNLRSDSAGSYFNAGDLSTLSAKMKALCAAAVGTEYDTGEALSLSHRQVQYYILHGVLVTHTQAQGETWSWAMDPESEYRALRQEVDALGALIGDINAALDTVLLGTEGEGGDA